ncbi:TB2/DP1, HVA22 family [Nesidiocoris tenuis]|uniref:Receptor expression-enhancing protein n=1 Tax=Nesidiocoris tenuis TaxID=355587 RepID=A0ABN7B2K3_9HEMI|nr:TB2/DP1, HVA22 family [Nesidiocoris tenuis]
MITQLVSRVSILTFGVLYPAYGSYKAVRAKNVKEYLKWMMYWIIFAIFLCVETFTDVLLGFWFPFYYEIKVALVFWLHSPATRGSSFLYRKFVHPALIKREHEIDEVIASTRRNGYSTLLGLGSKGLAIATNAIAQTVAKPIDTSSEDLATSLCFSDRVADENLELPYPPNDADLGGTNLFGSVDNLDSDELWDDKGEPVSPRFGGTNQQNL